MSGKMTGARSLVKSGALTFAATALVSLGFVIGRFWGSRTTAAVLQGAPGANETSGAIPLRDSVEVVIDAAAEDDDEARTDVTVPVDAAEAVRDEGESSSDEPMPDAPQPNCGDDVFNPYAEMSGALGETEFFEFPAARPFEMPTRRHPVVHQRD